jgi:hypothetical protein
MNFDPGNFREYLAKGEKARLFAVVSDGSKEQRACSALLSCFMAVPDLAKELLRELGAPATQRAEIHCFTEPVFKAQEDKKLRPDGLIVVKRGDTTWTAFVEAKVGKNYVDASQLESYLKLARELEFNAVISISNQFTSKPSLHPVSVNGHLLRKLGLFHWSWVSLRSKAILMAHDEGIEDREQAYIVSELLRYLDHKSSGISDFESMGSRWKELCDAVRNEVPLSKSGVPESEAISDWHQLLRWLSLDLSTKVGEVVDVYSPRALRNDPSKRVDTDLDSLKVHQKLAGALEIPHASSRLYLEVSLPKRTVTVAMWVNGPQDKTYSSACQTWIRSQIDHCEDRSLRITAVYPRNTQNVEKTLEQIRNDKDALTSTDKRRLPVGYWVRRVVPLGQSFTSRKKFVSSISDVTTSYYQEVGECLSNWVPPAPKVNRPQLADADSFDEEDECEGGRALYDEPD